MKHRGRIVPGNQQGLARLALNKVGIVGNDRRDLAVDSLLTAIGIHPRARALARPRVRIEVPQADMFAGGLVRDFPAAYIWMRNGHVRRPPKFSIQALPPDPQHPSPHLFTSLVTLNL